MGADKPNSFWRNRPYATAVACYLAIPVVVIGGAALSRLIDPEMALRSSDYGRNYRLLEMVRHGGLLTAMGLAVLLWAGVCYLVLESRHRSPLWLVLAAGGPFGFMFIAMLGAPEFAAAEMLYIHPDECIDCGACVPACPVEAIFADSDVPEKWQNYTGINAEYFKK